MIIEKICIIIQFTRYEEFVSKRRRSTTSERCVLWRLLEKINRPSQKERYKLLPNSRQIHDVLSFGIIQPQKTATRVPLAMVKPDSDFQNKKIALQFCKFLPEDLD